MRIIRRRIVQAVVVGALGLLAAGARASDEGSCMALCQMQQAYCDARGGELVGVCWYDHTHDICNLNGCRLQN